jgi:hypothetical protein
MQVAMRALEDAFPGCAIALLVAPFNGPPGARVNWVSNGNREDMAVLMKEMLARWEGRRHEAPETKQ